MGSQDVASKDTAANQSSSGTSHSDARPDIRPESRNSGMSERAGMRQSFQGESNSRSNWNMGFTDAASAAQAAAESAEMASMAARAAAELSIQGRITRQHSSESHKSFTRDSRDERHDRHAKESSSSQSFHDRNPSSRPENHVSSNLSVKESHKSFTRDSRDESHDRHAKESSSNQSFHDRNPNSRPENHASSNLSGKKDDDRRPNLKQNYSTESRKSSKEDSLGADRNFKLQNERVEKQEHDNYLERAAEMNTKNTNTGQRQGYYRKSSFEDEEATANYSEMSIKNPNTEPEVKPLTDSWQESYEPKNLNPFGGEKFEKRLSSDSSSSSSVNLSNSKVEHIQESNHNSSNDDEEEDYEKTVVFDEYKLEESKMVFDVEPTYDEVESSNSYFRSPDKIPSMEKSNSDDFGTVNFDDSASPKFDSEDEFEESSRIPADETHSPSETRPRFDFDDVRTEASVVEEPNNSPSKTKPRFDFDDVRTESSAVEEPNNSFSREDSSSGSDSGTGLGFTPLTGGFRNKGYRLPPYKKSADGPATTDQKSDITNVRSSFKSTEIRNSDEKLRSTVPTAVSDSKTYLTSDVTGVKSSFKPTETRKPDVKLSPIVPTAVSDSDSDDFTQEFQQQKPKVTDFDDSTDSDDDMLVNIPSNRNRFGSGLSRRTKGPTTPSTSGSRVRTRPESQSQSQTLSNSRSQHSTESREDPNQLEKRVTSKPYTEPKVRNQIAGTSSRSRVQLRAESQSQTLPEPRSEARVVSIVSPKPFKNQLGLEKHATPEPLPEPKVQTHRPSLRSESQSQTLTESRSQTRTENKTDHKPNYEPKPADPQNQTQKDRLSSEKPVASKPIPEPKPSEARNQTHRDRLGSEKPAASKPIPEPKVRSSEDSSVGKSEKNSSLTKEDSGSNNGSVSHVHPKLPDYDDVFARFQALRENRK
jgi:vacuolar protein sorting-associated protein IST1